MCKQSKRNRRRLQQSGLGGGLTIVRTVPISVQRGLPHAPALSDRAKCRLLCVEQARRTTAADASVAFGVSRATVYRWLHRDDPADLTTLESGPGAPGERGGSRELRPRRKPCCPCANSTRATASANSSTSSRPEASPSTNCRPAPSSSTAGSNGSTARREFWECGEGELDLPTLQQALRAWEDADNTQRPPQALGYATPRPPRHPLRLICLELAHPFDTALHDH